MPKKEQDKKTQEPPESKQPEQKAPESKQPEQKKPESKQPNKKTIKNGNVVSINSIEETKTEAISNEIENHSVQEVLPPKEPEQITSIKLNELHPFKNHPFAVTRDIEMEALVSSVKDKGITQPIVVRPREDGGYEIVSGHRRKMASELAGYESVPCIVRNLNDDEAITQMVEDNTTSRENIKPTERGKALKMQLEAIKHQGASKGDTTKIDPNDLGKRSNQIVAERNKTSIKQVQRYIRLTELVPELQDFVDKGKVGLVPAVEMSYIKDKNQRYIANNIEALKASPSQAQAKRMRELDQKGLLNNDVIDGIFFEEKKEVKESVILTTEELRKYFGEETTPKEMKEQILKLLDGMKQQQKSVNLPPKKEQKEK